MRQDICDGCKAERPKGKQWFYAYSDIGREGRILEPIATWCPSCAPGHLVAARKERAKRNLSRTASKRRSAAP